MRFHVEDILACFNAAFVYLEIDNPTQYHILVPGSCSAAILKLLLTYHNKKYTQTFVQTHSHVQNILYMKYGFWYLWTSCTHIQTHTDTNTSALIAVCTECSHCQKVPTHMLLYANY